MTDLKKSLKPIHLWAIAVGLVISGDYFGWSNGFGVASPIEFIAAIAMVSVFYLCFAFSFTELSTAIPNAGGPFAYSRKALGNLGGFVAGFATLVEFLLAPPAIAVALGDYLHFLFPVLPQMPIAIGSMILFTLVNLAGVEQTARFELIITIIAVVGIILYMVLAAPHFQVVNLSPEKPFQWTGFFAAIPFAIWFYLALEGVAMAAEETKNPTKDIPRGYLMGIGTLVVLALGVSIFTAGLGINEALSKTDKPLAMALQHVLGDSWVVKFFAVFGICGIMASLLGIILGYSRQIYAQARAGFLPPFLAKLSKNESPYMACIVGGIIGIICILSGQTADLITLSVLGALVMYLISMVSLFVLRYKMPDMPRPFKTPFYPLLPIIAIVLGLVCLLALIFYNPILSLIFLGAFLLMFLLFKSLGQYVQDDATI